MSGQKKYVYKVVFREVWADNGKSKARYLSSGVSYLNMEYKIRELAQSPIRGTPLFTFDSISNALVYVKDQPFYRIMACEHGPKVRGNRMLTCHFICNPFEKFCSEFWHDPNRDSLTEITEPLIPGTVLVEWVRPVGFVPMKNR